MMSKYVPCSSCLAVILLFVLLSPVRAEKGDPLAGTVVRSKEYVVKRTPHKIEEFIGDVYYRNADRQIRSDWAKFDHLSQVWQARGHVQGLLRMKDGTPVRVWGEEAEHNMKTERGWIEEQDSGHPIRFEHTPNDVPQAVAGEENCLPSGGEGNALDCGTAKRFEWDEKTSKAWARGDVHIWGERGEAWGEVAEYDHDQRLLTMTGRRPVIVHHEPKWSGALQADRIRALEGERRVQGDGKVQGWIIFQSLHDSGIKP